MVVAREKDAVSLFLGTLLLRKSATTTSSKMLSETLLQYAKKQYGNKIHTSLNWTIFNLQLSLGDIHDVIEYD